VDKRQNCWNCLALKPYVSVFMIRNSAFYLLTISVSKISLDPRHIDDHLSPSGTEVKNLLIFISTSPNACIVCTQPTLSLAFNSPIMSSGVQLTAFSEYLTTHRPTYVCVVCLMFGPTCKADRIFKILKFLKIFWTYTCKEQIILRHCTALDSTRVCAILFA